MHAIIGVMGHFVNKDGKCYFVIFRLHEIIGEHIGENIAGVFIDLFCDYGIVNNIGYFIADNVESNNTCIDAIFCTLYLNMSTKLCKGRQLYYFGYIINLCI